MQRRFWAGAVRPFGFPSLNVLRLPSKRLRNGHLAWGDFASKLSFERTIAEGRDPAASPASRALKLVAATQAAPRPAPPNPTLPTPPPPQKMLCLLRV